VHRVQSSSQCCFGAAHACTRAICVPPGRGVGCVVMLQLAERGRSRAAASAGLCCTRGAGRPPLLSGGTVLPQTVNPHGLCDTRYEAGVRPPVFVAAQPASQAPGCTILRFGPDLLKGDPLPAPSDCDQGVSFSKVRPGSCCWPVVQSTRDYLPHPAPWPCTTLRASSVSCFQPATSLPLPAIKWC
jgi:hypothetical protein